MAKVGNAAKYIEQDFSPLRAQYLAEPYEGMGHHFFPRNAFKPIRLPRDLSDSVFNVLKPSGMSRGDFYELHYKVDPEFDGTGIASRGGGGGWSGKKLGLDRYGLLGRLWHGSPAPLHAAVGSIGAAGSANYEPEGEAAP
jgi:hypothetical protein